MNGRDKYGHFIKGHKSFLPKNWNEIIKKIAKEKNYGKWMIGKKLSQETKNKISKAMIKNGNKPPGAKGRKLSIEHREKISKANIGNKNCLGKKRPLEVRIKISEKHKGEKNCNWKGGLTKKNYKERITIMNSFEYKQWRKTIFERDKYTCQKCGKIGGYLECHHIKSFKEYPELRLNLNNGITLCKKCHKLETYGK